MSVFLQAWHNKIRHSRLAATAVQGCLGYRYHEAEYVQHRYYLLKT